MEDKDAKLLQARQLLKKYQNKREHHDHVNGVVDVNSSRCTSRSNGETVSDVGSVNSSRSPSTVVWEQPAGLHSNMNHFSTIEQEEMVFIKKRLAETEQSLRDVVGKLQNLQTHYAELHTAYTAANQELQNARSNASTDTISKLQAALNVAVQEKTTYQSEIRTLTNKLTALEAENGTLSENLSSVQHSFVDHDGEKKKLREEIDRLALNLSTNSAELDRQRRDYAVLESKMRQVNQDRNDTQARLKYIFNEKEELEKSVAQVKHELLMKEIFIKQLTFHDPGMGESGQDALAALNNEKTRFEEENKALKATISEASRQHKATTDHYESCLSELNRRLMETEGQLNVLKTEKEEAESAKLHMEEKMATLLTQQIQNSMHVEDAVSPETVKDPSTLKRSPPTPAVDQVELDALKNSLSAAREDYGNAVNRVRELELTLSEKEVIVGNLERALETEKTRVDHLRNDVETQKTVHTDVHLLLEQLQNEKATVSRAIAQNLELKDQLCELQDKLVTVTNESAVREDERQTCLSVIDKLRHQIEEMHSTKQAASQECQTDETAPVAFCEHRETQTELEARAIQVQPDGTQSREEAVFPAVVSQSQESAVSENLHTAPEPLRVTFSPTPSSSSSDSSCAPLSRDQVVNALENKLESLANEKKEIMIANEKLKYFMTALESENESIGEYIAMYRFQRSNMQKKVAEKDMQIAQLVYEKKAAQGQISDLQQVLYNLFGQSPQVLTAGNNAELKPLNANGAPLVNGTGDGESASTERDLVAEKLDKIILEIQHKQHATSLENRQPDFDPKLHCPECRGQMFTL